MRGKYLSKIGGVLCIALGIISSGHSEPIKTASITGGRKPGLRQFRPMIPVQRKAVESPTATNRPSEPAAKPAAAKLAGKSAKLNRIPPPPIPNSAEPASAPVQEPTPAAAPVPEQITPLSTEIIEPPIPGAEPEKEDPTRLKFTPAASMQDEGDYENAIRVTYADVPPPTESEETESLEEADQLPEPKPTSEPEKSSTPGSSSADGPTLSKLRSEAHRLANQGLDYKFGFDDPDKGGLDCSGVVQHLLTSIGIKGCPRTSYDQYYWMRNKKTLDDVFGKKADEKLFKKLAPGDLIFWGNTWKSGHRVSHVMIYMGWNPETDKHYIFGAQGKRSKGMLGNGVDIFELEPNRGRLIGHGKIPGLIYD